MMGAFQWLVFTFLTIEYCLGKLSLEQAPPGSKAPFKITGGYYGSYSPLLGNGMRPRMTSGPVPFGKATPLKVTYKGSNKKKSQMKTRIFRFKELTPKNQIVLYSNQKNQDGNWASEDDKIYSLKHFQKMISDPNTIIQFQTPTGPFSRRKNNGQWGPWESRSKVWETIYPSLGAYFDGHAQKSSRPPKRKKTPKRIPFQRTKNPSTLDDIEEGNEPPPRTPPAVPNQIVPSVVQPSHSGTYVVTLVANPPEIPYLMITGGQEPIKMEINGQKMEMRRMGITNTWQLVQVKGSTLTFQIVGDNGGTKHLPMKRFRKILNDKTHPTVISLKRQRTEVVTRLNEKKQPRTRSELQLISPPPPKRDPPKVPTKKHVSSSLPMPKRDPPPPPNNLARQVVGDIYDGRNGQDLYALGFEEGYRDALRQRMRGY